MVSDGFEWEGKLPVRSERVTIEIISEDISLAVFLRTIVGIVSRSQNELDDWVVSW